LADIRNRTGAKGTTYQVRYASKAADGGYAYKTFDTRKAARAFLDEGLPKHRHASRLKDIVSVPAAIDKWLDVCRYEGREGKDPVGSRTAKNYEWRAEIMKTYDWTKEIHELEGPDIVAFRSWLLSSYSRDTAKKVLSSFHSVLLEMGTQGIIKTDAAAGVTIQKSRYENEVEIPSIDEIQTILRTADELANHKNYWIAKGWKRYRPMIYLAADTGMRPQEYLALTDSDLQERGVRIVQALNSDNKIGPPKSPAARRYIPVGTETLKLVRAYQKGREGAKPGGLLFPAENGGHQRYSNYLRRCWHKLMEHAGLMDMSEIGGQKVCAPRYTPYSLRHFYASMLIAKNRDLKTIQERMGHVDATMTLRVYGHLIRQKEAEKREEEPSVLEEVYRSCGEAVASAL
jgi:integrase